MKILLSSIGTRGDIEPFLAVGEILERRGHEVIYSFPSQFATLVPDPHNFFPLSPKFIELIQSEEGRAVMGKVNLWKKVKALIYLYRQGNKINKELIEQQYRAIHTEDPDLIIHNAKCSYPTLWGLAKKKPSILLSPVPFFIHRVDGYPHIGFNLKLGEYLNKLSYRLANFGLTKSIYDGQRWLPTKYQYPKSVIRKQLLNSKIIYAISPQLFSRPQYWPKHAQVLGFHERDRRVQWKPTLPLQDFINQYDRIVFLTFGSMINTQPKRTSRLLYKALDDLNIPTIVNTAAGGLVELPEYKFHKNFHFVTSIPYEWIFKKVYAVIHHGGSGTTHTALKYGCASLIIPHVIDQFGWNDLVYKLGAGPKGVSIHKLTSSRVKALMSSLYQDKKYKKKAGELSGAMLQENLEEHLCDFIATH